MAKRMGLAKRAVQCSAGGGSASACEFGSSMLLLVVIFGRGFLDDHFRPVIQTESADSDYLVALVDAADNLDVDALTYSYGDLVLVRDVVQRYDDDDLAALIGVQNGR